ncbi:Uncharacterized protein QTN25_005602 [Entamoeba marina]
MLLCLVAFFIASYADDSLIIFKDGDFKNGWNPDDDGAILYQTSTFGGRMIFFAKLDRDGFIDFKSNVSVDVSTYKYFSFAMYWEDSLCNLEIKTSLGKEDNLQQINFLPSIIVVKSWNQIVVNLTSLTTTTFDTIRISKTDLTPTHIMFNDLMLTNEEITPGTFEYSEIESSSSSEMKHDDVGDGENTASTFLSLIALALLALF